MKSVTQTTVRHVNRARTQKGTHQKRHVRRLATHFGRSSTQISRKNRVTGDRPCTRDARGPGKDRVDPTSLLLTRGHSPGSAKRGRVGEHDGSRDRWRRWTSWTWTTTTRSTARERISFVGWVETVRPPQPTNVPPPGGDRCRAGLPQA